jgi:carboxyl-terminal processing protease
MASRAFRDELAAFLRGDARDTDAFILDIRDGFGGRPEGYMELFDPDREDSYKQPLVVIVNEGSRSAKEVFAFRIKNAERATLIGSRSAGHVLGTTPFKIREWAYFEIPIVEFKVNGVSLEGRGVEPHIKIDRETGPNGEDLFLARSLEFLGGAALQTTLQLLAGTA